MDALAAVLGKQLRFSDPILDGELICAAAPVVILRPVGCYRARGEYSASQFLHYEAGTLRRRK
jgi:hypothetical protein